MVFSSASFLTSLSSGGHGWTVFYRPSTSSYVAVQHQFALRIRALTDSDVCPVSRASYNIIQVRCNLLMQVTHLWPPMYTPNLLSPDTHLSSGMWLAYIALSEDVSFGLQGVFVCVHACLWLCEGCQLACHRAVSSPSHCPSLFVIPLRWHFSHFWICYWIEAFVKTPPHSSPHTTSLCLYPTNTPNLLSPKRVLDKCDVRNVVLATTTTTISFPLQMSLELKGGKMVYWMLLQTVLCFLPGDPIQIVRKFIWPLAEW